MFIKFHTRIAVSIIRWCAEHNNHNSWICMFLAIPFELARSSSVTKSCLPDMKTVDMTSSWNFIQILSIIRRHAEHKNHNSCLYRFMYFTCLCTLLTFWVYTPLLYQNQTSCTKLHHSNRGETPVFTQKTNCFKLISFIPLFIMKRVAVSNVFYH